VPDHFGGWSLGARFYPVLYLLTRTRQARDWRTGIELHLEHLGKMQRPEVHHIFPKAKLYRAGYKRALVNAVANYCFQTKDTNLWISDRMPEEYFRVVRDKQPGALESHWIPTDEDLWRSRTTSTSLKLERSCSRMRSMASSRSFTTVPCRRSKHQLRSLSWPPRPDLGSRGSRRHRHRRRGVPDPGAHEWVAALGLPEGQSPTNSPTPKQATCWLS